MLICVQLLLTSVDTVFKMPKIFVKKKYEVYMINKTAILSLILFFYSTLNQCYCSSWTWDRTTKFRWFMGSYL